MNRKHFKRVLVCAIILSTIPIFLYIYKFGSFSFSSNINDWGTLGDYIGGILGISLTAITIYLLYETYATQNAQLKIQGVDSDIKYIDLQYDQIIKDINDISFNHKKGSDALYAWDDSHLSTPNNVVNTLNFIVHTFNTHVETIHLNKSIDNETKEQFLARAYLMYHSKMIWPVLSKIYNDTAFKEHTDNLYKNFNKLIKDTYDYLVPLNKLAKPNDSRILALYN